jgi:hypothetical protein
MPHVTGSAAAREHRIGIGGEDDMRQVSDQWLERGAHTLKIGSQTLIEQRLRTGKRSEQAAPFEQCARPRFIDNDVRNDTGKIDVVGADSQQHQIQRARFVALVGLCQQS